MKKSNVHDSRNELQRKMREEAQLRVKIESRVQLPPKYKTLYFGLKINHERYVAVIHPLMFLLRRIIYAVVIVYMAEQMICSVVVVMISCLIMLAYALSEWQWKDKFMNF